MLTVDELKKRILNGEAVDTIADEMAKMLNQAQKSVEEERANSKMEQDFMEACRNATIKFNYAIKVYSNWKHIDLNESKWDDSGKQCAEIIKLMATLTKSLCSNSKDDFESVVERFLREQGID